MEVKYAVVVCIQLLFGLLLPHQSFSLSSTPQSDSPVKEFQKRVKQLGQSLTSNPVARTIINGYDFFYWFPRRNIPYDLPFRLFKNNTAQFLAWYQLPHNLPPYAYLGEGYPDDFFCWGLPGNTLPLGNWDPCGFQSVSKKVVRKYRESELKHGRLAMLAVMGCLLQETSHPLHPEIGK